MGGAVIRHSVGASVLQDDRLLLLSPPTLPGNYGPASSTPRSLLNSQEPAARTLMATLLLILTLSPKPLISGDVASLVL